MKQFRFLVITLVALSLTLVSQAQESLQDALKNLGQDVAQAYVQPIASGFGADLNSGWLYRAPQVTTFGFDLDFGVVAMGSFMPNDAKTINKSAQFQFSVAEVDQITSSISDTTVRGNVRDYLYSHPLTVTVTGATVVGSKSDSLKVMFSGGEFTDPVTSQTVNLNPQNVTLPVGGLLEDIPLLPFAAIQGSIGTVYGTKAVFRFLPELEIDAKVGKFSYFGFGIQHNPFMWIPVPEPPVDVSLGFFTQNMKVGSILDTKATLFGLQASKTFGPGALNVTPYAGVSFESSSMTVSYTFDAPDPNPASPPGSKIQTPVSFTLTGDNSARLTLGLSFKLAIFKLNADYNIAKYNTFSAGFGFII